MTRAIARPPDPAGGAPASRPAARSIRLRRGPVRTPEAIGRPTGLRDLAPRLAEWLTVGEPAPLEPPLRPPAHTGLSLFAAAVGIAIVLVVSLVEGWGRPVVLAGLLACVITGAATASVAALLRRPVLASLALLSAVGGWPLLIVAMALESFGRGGTYEHEPVLAVALIASVAMSAVLRPPVATAWVAVMVAGLSAALQVSAALDGRALLVVVSIALASFVGIGGRITVDRLLHARERLSGLMQRLAAGPTLEATASAIAEELRRACGFDLVLVARPAPDGSVRHLGHASRLPRPFALAHGDLLPRERAGYIHGRIHEGPWVADWTDSSDGTGYEMDLFASGLRILLYVPVRHAGSVLALVAMGFGKDSGQSQARRRTLLYQRLEAVVEAAPLVGALLAPQLAELDESTIEAAAIEAIIADLAFEPAFQPIVDLATGEPVAYEALTRFAGGERPDLVFGRADRAGLGGELEAVTMEAAIRASRSLAAGPAIHLNVSPAFLEDSRLPQLLADACRPVTLEITEHVEIPDYAALRAAARALGPGVGLAVDDAGAGFASLRHVLELRPDTVKLDLALVRGIDADPARQALVAGMVHFVRGVGASIVAEGVETAAERRTLLDLGVPFGQGYLFGAAAVARISRTRSGGTATTDGDQRGNAVA